MADPLDKWQRSGSQPVAAPVKAETPALGKYESFKKDGSLPARLFFRCGPRMADRALPYGYITKITTDGWSVISICFYLPWPGPLVVDINGECLGPVADAIVAGTAVSVEVFDPARHIDPEEGIAIIREIVIQDQSPLTDDNTKH